MLTDESARLPVEEIDLVDNVERQLKALDLAAEVDVNDLHFRRHEAETRRKLQLPDELMLLHRGTLLRGSSPFRIHRHGTAIDYWTRKRKSCSYDDEQPYIAGR